MQTVEVPLGVRSYRIWIGQGLLERLGAECRALGLGPRCAVVTDTNVGRLYARQACESLRGAGFDPVVVTIRAGEPSKSLRTAARCYSKLVRHRLDRQAFVVALGGGVVGDLAGFVAATFLRGIAYVQVPTSLLAQVDSSVGGKVAVNLKEGKNLVGAFYQPRLVLCDVGTLATLPEREYRSGLAEVAKYGVIADARLFEQLEANAAAVLARHFGLLEEFVARCCQIKADVVAKDETESGLRQILNFGHTIGHALEAVAGYGRLLHGEAVALGMAAAAHISMRVTGLSAEERDRLVRLLTVLELPVRTRLTQQRRRALLQTMRLDKKARAGQVTFVLARRLGEVVWGQSVPEAVVNEALDFISAGQSKG